jgi:hypothetical protein
MSLRPGWLRWPAALCAAGVVWAMPLSAQSVLSGSDPAVGVVSQSMTPASARLLARQALDQGRPDIAAEIARQILSANPADAEALMLMSAAEARLGHGAAGAVAGRKAFRLAQDPAARFEAAFLTAMAFNAADRGMAAKFWLRRAGQVASTDDERAAAKKGYAQLNAHTRLSFRITGDIGPSANVNGGSLHDTMVIIGLPFSIPEALPGGTWGLGVSGSYRVSQSQNGATDVFAEINQRGAWLSDRAKAQEPTAKASDFALTTVDVGLSRRWKSSSRPLVFSVTGSVGRRWYGGEALSTNFQADGHVDWIRSENRIWSLGLALERAVNAQRSDRNADVAELTLTLRQKLDAQASVYVTGGLRNTWSLASDISNHARFLRVGWTPGALPGGVMADLSMGLEQRDYVRLGGLGDDLKLNAAASFTFSRIDYMGFSPKVTVAAERNRSEFLPRDTRDLSVGFGISSTF